MDGYGINVRNPKKMSPTSIYIYILVYIYILFNKYIFQQPFLELSFIRCRMILHFISSFSLVFIIMTHSFVLFLRFYYENTFGKKSRFTARSPSFYPSPLPVFYLETKKKEKNKCSTLTLSLSPSLFIRPFFARFRTFSESKPPPLSQLDT